MFGTSISTCRCVCVVVVVVVVAVVIFVVDVVDMIPCAVVGNGDEQKTTFIALWLRVVNFWVIIP